MKKAPLLVIALLLLEVFPLSVRALDEQVQKWAVIIGGEDALFTTLYGTYYCYHVMTAAPTTQEPNT